MDEACQWEVVSGPGYDDQAFPVFDQVFASVPLALSAIKERGDEIVKALELEEAEAARLADGSSHAVDWNNDGDVPDDVLLVIQPVFLTEPAEVKLRAPPRSRPSSLAERARQS
jgi:hypothetical protein